MKDLFLGVEIGGTKLQLGIGNTEGELLYTASARVRSESGAEGILQWLEINVPAVMDRARDYGGIIRGIGVGFGGPIESMTGRVLESVQVRGWGNFDLKNWFADSFSLPVVIANDSDAACWGEYCRGTGRGTRHFFYMNIGSGIGGGLVLNGSLYTGQGYGAAEIGHTYIADWTKKNKVQQLEQLCSGWSIEKRLRSPGYIDSGSMLFNMCGGDIGKLTCVMLGEAAQRGDRFAADEINRVAESVGIALSGVLCMLSPECISIGGGVSNLGDIIIDPIREYTGRYEFLSSKGRYRIKKCRLEDSVVLAGAVLLIKDFFIGA